MSEYNCAIESLKWMNVQFNDTERRVSDFACWKHKVSSLACQIIYACFAIKEIEFICILSNSMRPDNASTLRNTCTYHGHLGSRQNARLYRRRSLPVSLQLAAGHWHSFLRVRGSASLFRCHYTLLLCRHRIHAAAVKTLASARSFSEFRDPVTRALTPSA